MIKNKKNYASSGLYPYLNESNKNRNIIQNITTKKIVLFTLESCIYWLSQI